MPRYKLRTLQIVLALGPMVLAAAWPSVTKLLFPPKLVIPQFIGGEDDPIYDPIQIPEP